MKKTPSIRTRLGTALLGWTLVWCVGVSLAVGVAAQHEVEELLDESLQATALLLSHALASSGVDDSAMPATDEGEFAWQLVSTDGRVLRRSSNAPPAALQRSATAGLSRTRDWRVFGSAMGSEGRMLYVAHTMNELVETQAEVVISAVLAALSIGLLGYLWLRLVVKHELQPLERLTARLMVHDPLANAHTLGAAERTELASVHAAIDNLGQRLARRMAHERAFASHAAHALRTPLAGMDAQLAVALRESPPEQQQRLQRVREASGRLQRVVRSMLDLFRAGGEVHRQAIDLCALMAHLPVEHLQVVVDAHAPLHADPDLLAAALANLLDNAQRYGAKRVTVSLPAPATLRVHNDGPGLTAERRAQLRSALSSQDYEHHAGLGLMLADLVARAHGGALGLPETDSGFAVDLSLGTGPERGAHAS
jgi:signal transduction histidine kinase